MSGEHSPRGKEVTMQVGLWLANEGDFDPKHDGKRVAEVAAEFARAEDYTALADYATGLIKRAVSSQAAWHVKQELASNDFDRINWEDVAQELIGI